MASYKSVKIQETFIFKILEGKKCFCWTLFFRYSSSRGMKERKEREFMPCHVYDTLDNVIAFLCRTLGKHLAKEKKRSSRAIDSKPRLPIFSEDLSDAMEEGETTKEWKGRLL